MYKNTWSDFSSFLSGKQLIAGFTNQNFPYSSTNDRAEFAKILKLDYRKLIIPKQIHSNNVTICTEAGILIDTDGIITNSKDSILSIQVADCIPIFVYDAQKQYIGLIHAGWRGVTSGIVKNSIQQMKNLGSNPIDIKVLLGPSIRQCCYEVGPEVGQYFEKKYQANGKDDRMQLNLQDVVSDKLINLNIQNENIFDVKVCTCCSDQYYSFRRDGNKAGRMIGMMGWQSSE